MRAREQADSLFRDSVLEYSTCMPRRQISIERARLKNQVHKTVNANFLQGQGSSSLSVLFSSKGIYCLKHDWIHILKHCTMTCWLNSLYTY